MELERDPDTNVTPTVFVLLIHEDKVLLVKHLEGSAQKKIIYGLPGGIKDYDEKEKEAAVREFEEETGLRTKKEFLLPFPHNIFTAQIARKDGTLELCSMQVFLCRAFKGALKSSHETKPEWVKLSKLSNYKLLPNIEKAIENGLSFATSLNYE